MQPIEEAAQSFSETTMFERKKCMPFKTVTVGHKDTPWFTQTLLELKRKKDRIHKQATKKKKKNQQQTNKSGLAHLWQSFRQTRNEYIYEIRKRKMEYLKELDEKASCNETLAQKNWWKLVEDFLSKKGFSTNDISPIEADGNSRYSSNEKENVFNTFFTSQSSIEVNDDDIPDITTVNTCIEPTVLSVTDVKFFF